MQRSTWRVVDPNAQPLSTSALVAAPVREASPSSGLVVVLVAGALVIALGVFILSRPPAPVGSDMTREIQQVSNMIAAGKPAIAVALAENFLAQQNPVPSPEARQKLVRLWYIAGVDVLFETPAGDSALGRQAVVRWLAIEKRADDYGVAQEDRLHPMSIGKRAYSASLWALADASLLRAFAVNGDLSAVELRMATLRNWGNWLAFNSNNSSDMRNQGVRLLATARAIDVAYNLRIGVPADDLKKLGYTEGNYPLPDSLDPMLAAAGE